jgi:hypothetical protein
VSRSDPRRRALAGTALALALLLRPAASEARVFHSRAEALALAFPDADRVDSRTFVLDEAQARRIEGLARAPLESRIVTLHAGMKGEHLLGYAVIDVHTVRTLPEALLIVLSPEGQVRSLRMLAFHEPEEYLTPAGWLRQFDGRDLDEALSLRGEIHGIAGATLSSRAVTGAVRRALATWQVLLAPGPPLPTEE